MPAANRPLYFYFLVTITYLKIRKTAICAFLFAFAGSAFAAAADGKFNAPIHPESERRIGNLVGFPEFYGGEDNIQQSDPVRFYRRADYSGEQHGYSIMYNPSLRTRSRSIIGGFQQYDAATGELDNQSWINSKEIEVTDPWDSCATSDDLEPDDPQAIGPQQQYGGTISTTEAWYDFSECIFVSAMYADNWTRRGYRTVLSDEDTEDDALARAVVSRGTSRAAYREVREGFDRLLTEQRSRFRVRIENDGCGTHRDFVLTMTLHRTSLDWQEPGTTTWKQSMVVSADESGWSEYVDVPLAAGYETVVDEIVELEPIDCGSDCSDTDAGNSLPGGEARPAVRKHQMGYFARHV